MHAGVRACVPACRVPTRVQGLVQACFAVALLLCQASSSRTWREGLETQNLILQAADHLRG